MNIINVVDWTRSIKLHPWPIRERTVKGVCKLIDSLLWLCKRRHIVSGGLCLDLVRSHRENLVKELVLVVADAQVSVGFWRRFNGRSWIAVPLLVNVNKLPVVVCLLCSSEVNPLRRSPHRLLPHFHHRLKFTRPTQVQSGRCSGVGLAHGRSWSILDVSFQLL